MYFWYRSATTKKSTTVSVVSTARRMPEGVRGSVPADSVQLPYAPYRLVLYILYPGLESSTETLDGTP